MVVEITGKSFEDFMRDNILVPLGMTSSRVNWDMDYVRQIAKPHDENGKRIAGKFYTPLERSGSGRRHCAIRSSRDADDDSDRLREVSAGVPESEAGGQLSAERG